MAPERWRGQKPSGAIDVWSIGVVLHELVVGTRPISDMSLAQLAFARPGVATVYEATGASWSALVADCLAFDASARPPIDELVRRLARLLDPRSVLDDAHCPFPGLAAFSRDNAADYFGRREELDAIVEGLRTRPLAVVAGPSGIGKSSFVYAALLPRLEEGGTWAVCVLRPGASPFHALAAALGSDRPDELARALRDEPERLSLALGAAATRAGGRALLFLDQFEECFTLAGADAAAFCNCIGRAALRDEPWRIVLTIRNDFLGHLAESPALRAHLGATTPLAPLSRADLRAAVLGPLANARYAVDSPALVERIVADVAGQPACLPLLQFTCRSLWERRDPESRALLAGDYEAIGGSSGALATHAEQLLAELSPADVRVARAVLLELLHPDGTRHPRLRSELLDGLPAGGATVVERLVAGRLVVSTRESESDDPRIEVAHEALATAWPRLARWRDESHEERALVLELEQAARLWRKRGKLPSETWSGVPLATTLERIARWRTVLPSTTKEFLHAAETRARRARTRRRWLTGVGIGSLSAVAIAAVFVALAISRRNEQVMLATADIGEFDLELEPFDWDADAQREQVPTSPPPLHWVLHLPSASDVRQPGEPYPAVALRHGSPTWRGNTLVERVEARSGAAFLEVDRGAACAPSWIYLQRLPDYGERGNRATIHLRVPTCQATAADAVPIPPGLYVQNIDVSSDAGSIDVPDDLPRYAIDRTEVTVAAFGMYASMARVTGDEAMNGEHLGLDQPDASAMPVVGVNHQTASNYCRYMGKQLPSVRQWQKAFRGALSTTNPAPRRATPWGDEPADGTANVLVASRPPGLAPVTRFADDRSPYGVLGLGGNASEWSSSMAVLPRHRGLRVVLGSDWSTPIELHHERISWRNVRADRYTDFSIGVRCAYDY